MKLRLPRGDAKIGIRNGASVSKLSSQAASKLTNREAAGERNKTWGSNSWGNPTTSHGQQLAALDDLSALLGANTSNSSSEHPNTYILNDNQSLLALEGCPEGYNDWSSNKPQSTPREEALYGHGAHSNGSNLLPSGQMSLPSLDEQFPLHGISINSENPNTGRPQEQQPQPQPQQQKQHVIRHPSTSKKNEILSPVSQLGANPRMGSSEVSKPNRPQASLQSQFEQRRVMRRSGSRAEQMISDVEKLYEFGISLSLFPEDPTLRKSLWRMKERFQSLVVLGDVSFGGERDHHLYDGDSADREDSDDEQEYGE